MINRIVRYIVRLQLFVKFKFARMHTQCLRLQLRYTYWQKGFTQAQASAAITNSRDWVLSLSDKEVHEVFKKVQAGEPLPYDPKVP